MGKYGSAAVRAVEFIHSHRTTSPEDAWRSATGELFGMGTSGQKKGCPRDTFLGLCAEGLVPGVPSGTYTKSKLNKVYGIRALYIIRAEPHLSDVPRDLWARVISPDHKAHNQQMDVVVALWKAGLIR